MFSYGLHLKFGGHSSNTRQIIPISISGMQMDGHRDMKAFPKKHKYTKSFFSSRIFGCRLWSPKLPVVHVNGPSIAMSIPIHSFTRLPKPARQTLPYLTKVRISMPYMPLPCLRTSRTQFPEWTRMLATIKRTIRKLTLSVEWRFIRYESITYHTNYCHPEPSIQNVLLGILNNPKNDHSGIKIAESAIPHCIYWLHLKMACKQI